MNEIMDDIFQSEKTNTPAAEFNKDEWAAKKQQQRTEVYALAEQTADEIASSGDSFKGYLDTMSRFDLYSPTNILLIYAQNPEATRIGDYDHWVEAETPVKRGEKGMTILEPGPEYTREDGSTAVSYNTKSVFDIKQTSAKPPEPMQPRNIKTLCQALVNSSPVPVKLVAALSGNPDNAAGALYQPKQNRIEIVQGLDGSSIFRCLSQEVALAQIDTAGRECQSPEFVAYAASYVLCKKNGVDAKSYDFSKVSDLFSESDSKAVRAEIGAVRDTVSELTSELGKKLEAQKAAKSQEAR